MRMGPTGFLWAWDKTNGDLLWEQTVSTRPQSTPMTYMYQGKQYVVMRVGGMEQKSKLVAFADVQTILSIADKCVFRFSKSLNPFSL